MTVRIPARVRLLTGHRAFVEGSAMAYSLGVDLGTAFVAAAVARDGYVETFPLGDRSTVMHTAVFVRDDGELLSGDTAARRAVTQPDRVALNIKRHFGNPTPLVVGGAPHAVTSLLGTVLRDVLDRVTEAEGGEPDSVALTVPASWGRSRRELFEDVPAHAGLSHFLTVTEPEAAAAHYAATHQFAVGEVIAVYDLGGGAFEAAVLRRTETGIEVLGTPEGIEHLGGADLDEAVFSHVDAITGGALHRQDLSDPRTVVALARLRQDCVLAKEALSFDTETTIPVFVPGVDVAVRLTRDDFHDMIRKPIEATLGALTRTLRTAAVTPAELSEVLLIGASSQVPLIAEMVSREFDRPAVVGANPKHAVARGAAVLARRLVGVGPEGSAGAPAPSRPLCIAASGPPAPPSAAPPSEVESAASRAGSTVDAPPAIPSPSDTASAPHAQLQPAASPSVAADIGTVRAGTERSSGAGDQPGRAMADPPDTGTTVPTSQATSAGSGAASPSSRDSGTELNAPVRRRVLVAVVVLVLVVVAGGAILIRAHPDPQGDQDGGSVPTSPAASAGGPAAPSTAPLRPVAASMPVPSLGSTIPVGRTPGHVVASPNGSHLYVADHSAGVITVVDTATDEVTATIPVPAGPPNYLAISPDGTKVYISVWDDARSIEAVSVLDTTTNSVTATIPVGGRPFVPSVTPDGHRVYVPDHDSGTIYVIDTGTNRLQTQIAVPPNPHRLAFTPDGTRAYVADHESNVIAVLDTTTDTVIGEIPVGNSPHSVAMHPTRPLVANVNYDASSVTVIDTNSDAVVATVPVGKNPQDITWAADGRFAYVVNAGDDTVSVISANDLAVTATIPTGGSPTSIAVLPDGSRAYVSDLDDGTLTVLDLAG